MVFWVRKAWKPALRKGFSLAGQHKHLHKANILHCPPPEFTSVGINRETLSDSFWGGLPGFRSYEDGSSSSFRDAVERARSEDRLQRTVKGILGLRTGGPEGTDASSFVREDSIFMCFAGLALLLNATVSYAEDQNVGLREQPQAKSNINTAKWRIFTDKARDLCSQGSFDDAERYFYKALEAAKLGFGEEDPHVASCYNNLAELFRMKKEYDKAEPLYLEAVKRLRGSSGMEDGSVGFALHNLGGFYLLQRKIEQARRCYEEALKIKGKALGLDHPEYANTMFHLGEVIRMQGDIHDGLALIRDSIRILEQVGLGNTTVAIKRLTRFSELLVAAGELKEAEAIQRKILQVLEFSKDYSFNDTVAALQNLSAILQKQGKLDDCMALLEESIRVLKDNKGEDDIQMAAVLSKLAGVWFHQGKRAASQKDSVQALVGYGKAESFVCKAVKIAEVQLTESNANRMKSVQGDRPYNMLLLARCLTLLGNIRIHKLDILADGEEKVKTWKDCESVLRHSISLLEEIMVQQGDQSMSEVWKLYKECSHCLAELNRKLSNMHEQGQG